MWLLRIGYAEVTSEPEGANYVREMTQRTIPTAPNCSKIVVLLSLRCIATDLNNFYITFAYLDNKVGDPSVG